MPFTVNSQTRMIMTAMVAEQLETGDAGIQDPKDCAGCKWLELRDEHDPGHCYMFADFMPGCQCYDTEKSGGRS